MTRALSKVPVTASWCWLYEHSLYSVFIPCLKNVNVELKKTTRTEKRLFTKPWKRFFFPDRPSRPGDPVLPPVEMGCQQQARSQQREGLLRTRRDAKSPVR
jgi:hypothetical protein